SRRSSDPGSAPRRFRSPRPRMRASYAPRWHSGPRGFNRRSRLLVAPFTLEERGLARRPPAVPAERAVGAHDAVAGDEQRDAIARARPRHRSDRARAADLGGDGGVRSRAAVRDLLQRLPDPPLKGGGGDVDGKLQRKTATLEMVDDLRGGFAQPVRGGLHLRPRVFTPQRLQQRTVAFAKRYR